ncbi:unnamed protein product [Prorocentrum cordatum]|uniref:Uncharacterized protein n=1 Tax=Prorocentrum cordatum TaxID=2364126 RepID=A0ABN9VNN0_9DINO|nr:unnamed protein product [Polarella glacialis]
MVRLYLNVSGQIPACHKVEDEDRFLAEQQAALSQGKWEMMQLSPVENPASILNVGNLVQVNVLMARLLRGVGGQQLTGRAPRGNMASGRGRSQGRGNAVNERAPSRGKGRGKDSVFHAVPP